MLQVYSWGLISILICLIVACGASSPGEADPEAESLSTREFIDEVIAIDIAYWNYVQIGLENSMQYTIQEGLERDATVITAGNLNLAHKVRVAVK